MIVNEVTFQNARIAAERLQAGRPIMPVDYEVMQAVIDVLAEASTIPGRVACKTCWGASQYEGWALGGTDASDFRRHRGDCPALCDFGYVIMEPTNA